MSIFDQNKIDISADYFKIRNIAWDFLIKNNVKEYPLDLISIIEKNNWALVSYQEFSSLKNISIEELKRKYSPSGFSFNHIIVINEELSDQVKRFTIAHEIGHIILHKLIPDKTRREKEANMFAARILMPMFLIKELNIKDKVELAKLCNVSEESAGYRLERYQKVKGREKFYTNPLERQMFENLKPFIYKVKKTV